MVVAIRPPLVKLRVKLRTTAGAGAEVCDDLKGTLTLASGLKGSRLAQTGAAESPRLSWCQEDEHLAAFLPWQLTIAKVVLDAGSRS